MRKNAVYIECLDTWLTSSTSTSPSATECCCCCCLHLLSHSLLVVLASSVHNYAIHIICLVVQHNLSMSTSRWMCVHNACTFNINKYKEWHRFIRCIFMIKIAKLTQSDVFSLRWGRARVSWVLITIWYPFKLAFTPVECKNLLNHPRFVTKVCTLTLSLPLPSFDGNISIWHLKLNGFLVALNWNYASDRAQMHMKCGNTENARKM